MSEKIKIKYLTDIDKISQAHDGEWFDLRCARDTYLIKGQFALIPLGISVELPDGYEAHVVPRSSTFKNYHIIQTNSFGVIDNGYRGEWMMPVYAVEDTEIMKHDRICQFRVMPVQPSFEVVEVDNLSETERGDGGFGSTGKN